MRTLSRWAATLAIVGLGTSVAPVTAPASTGPSRPSHTPLIYVANADNGPVTAYALSSSGAVSPAQRVRNPNNPDTFWDPWGVAVDRTGALYVQTFLSDATTFVFAPGATRPSRYFVAISPDVASVAIDSSGYEYTIGGEGPPEIDVLPPGAHGRPSALYHLTPIRAIQTDASDYNTWPSVLAVDSTGDLLASISRNSGNAIEVFEGGPSGPGKPVRVISGPTTGLGTCPTFDTCTHVAVTVAGGMIYALVSDASGVHLSLFRGGATGDVKPLRTVAGSLTGFSARVGTGIAVGSDGLIYTMIKKAQFQGKGQIEVFAAGATGNVTPIRTFTDANSAFSEGEGIAIG